MTAGSSSAGAFGATLSHELMSQDRGVSSFVHEDTTNTGHTPHPHRLIAHLSPAADRPRWSGAGSDIPKPNTRDHVHRARAAIIRISPIGSRLTSTDQHVAHPSTQRAAARTAPRRRVLSVPSIHARPAARRRRPWHVPMPVDHLPRVLSHSRDKS